MGCSSSRPAPTPARAEASGGAIDVDPMRRLKLVLLGDSGVGKSCLVLRYVRGAFDPSSKVTVGAAFMSHSLSLPDGKSVKFEIWDTAGQERYASLAPLYYRGASAAIVVYDITSKESFAKAKHWISELHKNASGSIVIVLVGNKTDLVEQREVFEEEGKVLADRHGMLFIETSAKTAANCALVFESIAKKLSGYLEPDTPATPTQTPGSQSGPGTPAIPASHVPSPESSSKAPPS